MSLKVGTTLFFMVYRGYYIYSIGRSVNQMLSALYKMVGLLVLTRGCERAIVGVDKENRRAREHDSSIQV